MRKGWPIWRVPSASERASQLSSKSGGEKNKTTSRLCSEISSLRQPWNNKKVADKSRRQASQSITFGRPNKAKSEASGKTIGVDSDIAMEPARGRPNKKSPLDGRCSKRNHRPSGLPAVAEEEADESHQRHVSVQQVILELVLKRDHNSADRMLPIAAGHCSETLSLGCQRRSKCQLAAYGQLIGSNMKLYQKQEMIERRKQLPTKVSHRFLLASSLSVAFLLLICANILGVHCELLDQEHPSASHNQLANKWPSPPVAPHTELANGSSSSGGRHRRQDVGNGGTRRAAARQPIEPELLDSSNSMTVRHEFKFTMNGRELLLEPPESDGQLQTGGIINKTRKASNRIGEYSTGAVQVDYDAGFDVADSPESPNSNRNYEASNQQHKDRSSSLVSPSSTSAALMSSGYRSSGLLEGEAESTLSSSFDSTDYSPGNNVNLSKSTGDSRQAKNEDSNRIISDWPRNSSNSSQWKADRHPGGHKSSRFSTLLATTPPGKHNEHNQSESQWDGKQAGSRANTKSALNGAKWATKAASLQADNGGQVIRPAGGKTTSVARNSHPKAPVYAKARYTSSASTATTTTTTTTTTSKPVPLESTGGRSKPQAEVIGPTNSTGAGSLKIDANQQAPTTTIEQPSSIAEYKTNFTNYAAAAGQQQQAKSARRQKTATETPPVAKARTVQRDLTLKSLRLPSTKQLLLQSIGRAAFLKAPVETTTSTRRPSNSSLVSSIVRSGPILPLPSQPMELASLMPALLAQQEMANRNMQQHQRSAAHLRALQNLEALGQKGFGEHMLATANQLGVTHQSPSLMASSESASYNSIASLHGDYTDRVSQVDSGPSNGFSSDSNGGASNGGGGSAANGPTSSTRSLDEQRGVQTTASSNGGSPPMDYQGDASSYSEQRPGPGGKSADYMDGTSDSLSASARSALADGFLQAKSRELGGLRSSSLDPFEMEIAGPLGSSEYERDLADLDDEFNRHSYSRRPGGPLMSDSFLTLSAERYEPRGRSYARRPQASLADLAGDYLAAAGSVANMVPRNYPRGWPGTSAVGQAAFSDNDLWSEDLGPAFAMAPSQAAYSYRWRPRYQRLSPFQGQPPSGYLAASASEQQLQPAFNLVAAPGGYPHQTAPSVPTETYSFTISPLAAAAAAAASALVAADKSRSPIGAGSWLTLPRLAASSLQSASTAPAPNSQPAAVATPSLPAGLQTAYIARPTSPYAFGSVPIYAIAAPRPAAASGAGPAYIPYFHAAGQPAFIALRPTGVLSPPPPPLLTAASFAYPLRLPAVRPAHSSFGQLTAGPSAGTVRRPSFLADLQPSESKSKTNLTGSDTKNHKGAHGSLTAMARNLTRKMFGSASQIRPQHVAPPTALEAALSTSLAANGSSGASLSSSSGSPMSSLQSTGQQLQPQPSQFGST